MSDIPNDDLLDADEPLPQGGSRALAVQATGDDADFERLERHDTLEPGFYWTAVKPVDRVAAVGDTLLLMDLDEFEERVLSVKLRMHPRNGRGSHTVMVAQFLDCFVPCHDGEAVRQREQQAVMQEVTEQQAELLRVQSDPRLMQEATKDLVEQYAKQAEQASSDSAGHEDEKKREREQNIGKVHRRAARRSAAKGNPLTTPRIAVSSEVGGLIGAGINQEGVTELTKMATQQAVVARAQSTWLKNKTESITKTLQALAPFVEERSAVALARASGAIKMAERIKRGIESLDLYTGKGVDVFDIRTGKEAPSSEPLTIIQGKRYAEEEFAVWADVDSGFDYRDKNQFFEAVANNDSLLQQLLPTPRCVVSIAMTRSTRQYGDALANLVHNIQNLLVFLMVRNGDNVHVVYSGSPSHEGAERLFPTENELGAHFDGMDGSRISIRDIEFGDASKNFQSMALVYRRFLILLCGLDHRLQLFGEFYPQDKQLEFMTLDFQARYFRFIADAEGLKLGTDLEPLADWMTKRNEQAQSGSRIFVLKSSALKASSPELKRRTSLELDRDQFKTPFIASREGQELYIGVKAEDRYGERQRLTAKTYLSAVDNDAHRYDGGAWWLCVDDVDVETIRRYRHSRVNRSMGVAYLRLFRRIEAYLDAELQAERESRDYLLTNAIEHGGMTEALARSALGNAVRNWRASRRGEALPTIADKAGLNEVLSLMVPAGHLAPALVQLLDDYLARNDVQPLLLTRSGKAKLVLYVAPTDADKLPYPAVLRWRWVRRVVLKAGKTKMLEDSSSLTWLTKVLPASEIEARRWPELESWLNADDEPITLRKYAQLLTNLQDSKEWEPVLKAGEGGGIEPAFFQRLLASAKMTHAKDRSRFVSTVFWSIPVALHSHGGVKLALSSMQAMAEHVLWFYGSAEQRSVVESYYVGLFGRSAGKEKAREALRSPLRWQMGSLTDFAHRHDEATANASMYSSSRKPWASHDIQINVTGSHFDHRGRSKKRRSEPNLRSSHSDLSLNRSLLQLTGVAPKMLRRAFYKGMAERLRRALHDWRWDSTRRSGDDDATEAQVAAERKASKRRIQEERYVHAYTHCLSPLVWDAERQMPLANAVFVAPTLTMRTREA